MASHSFPKIDQKEYLKKYLSGSKVKKKKKDKKHKTSKESANVKIIDDDLNHLDTELNIDEELLLTGEDAPQIVGEYIEEQPADKKVPKWKSIVIKDESDDDENNATRSKGDDLWGRPASGMRIKQESNRTPDNSPARRKDRSRRTSTSPLRSYGRKSPSPTRKSKRDKSPSKKRKNEDLSYQSTKIKIEPLSPHHENYGESSQRTKSRSGDNSDNSPPRRRRSFSGSPARRRKDSDQSPTRKSRPRRDSDQSPPRKHRKRKQSPYNYKSRKTPDPSPPRRRHNSDQSPQRKRKYSSDVSPPRRNRQRKQTPDNFHSIKSRKTPDASPPRRIRYTDQSPQRKRKYSSPRQIRQRKQTPDDSPPRRRRNSDQSPQRRRKYSSDFSPPRKNKQRKQTPDESPSRRRNSDQSPPRKTRTKSPNRSPARRRRKLSRESPPIRVKQESQSPRTSHQPRTSRWERQESEKSLSPPPTHKRKLGKTLEGKKAGLQDAKSLQQETLERRKKEDLLFEKMSSNISGRNAEVQVRSTGRKGRRAREAAAEDPEERRRKEEYEEKKKQQYERWGKGLKQIEDYKNRMAEHEYESSKPLARYANDEDLERHLKEQERAEDPMLEYMRQKRKAKEKESGKPQIPRYEGTYPENRFGIRPGYRWDGVDRSNGYEKKYFAVQNEKLARQDEAYKYSVEDM